MPTIDSEELIVAAFACENSTSVSSPSRRSCARASSSVDNGNDTDPTRGPALAGDRLPLLMFVPWAVAGAGENDATSSSSDVSALLLILLTLLWLSLLLSNLVTASSNSATMLFWIWAPRDFARASGVQPSFFADSGFAPAPSRSSTTAS